VALKVSDISFSYKTGRCEAVIDELSADFPRGLITAVTGPNACGKTTLAKLLTGILRPDAGEILIDSESIAGMTLTEIGRRVGFVMQDPSRQIFKTSVEEEIYFGLNNLRLADEEKDKRAEEYLSVFGLEKKRGAFPFELSTGERQRLVLAAILAMKPDYLILDEPTSALDKGLRRRLGTYLKGAAERDGVGVVLISHDEGFVTDIADRRVALGAEGGERR
jgi:energy-coupling factor transport system ATP-binding protein